MMGRRERATSDGRWHSTTAKARVSLRWLSAAMGALAIGLAGSSALAATGDAAPAEGHFPQPAKPPAGAPNIILVMTDDVGFGASATFGGPVPTPNLDRLAAHGVKYNRFHTTAMCSPTRAALLTGRNPHSVGMGALSDFAAPYPGYNAVMPKSAATVAEILRRAGYNTAFFGKHHDVPVQILSAAGPFDQWPTGLGFEYFFGFMGPDTDQWKPMLFRGTTRVPDEPVRDTLDKRLVDDAINWVHNQDAAAPDKPFFVYLAPGTAHTPLQAPADWIARFKGKFDKGWDKLRQDTLAAQKRMGIVPADTRLAMLPPGVKPWNSLSPDERRLQIRYMEVFAGTLAYQDAQFGRLYDEIERMGELENTLVIFIQGDNGGDAGGGPEGTLTEVGEIRNKVPTLQEKLTQLDEMGGPNIQLNSSNGWASAMSTPFPYYKQVGSHLGGTRNGMVVSWPARIAGRGVRSQYHHVIDVMPTILEAVGLSAPSVVDGVQQQPLPGTSMNYSFDSPAAKDRRTVQYYELLGNRAIYSDGWLASTTPMRAAWLRGRESPQNLASTYQWELYNISKDFSQTQNLADRHPEKLAQLKALFDEEAAKYQVDPISDEVLTRVIQTRKAYFPDRKEFTYWGNDVSVDTGYAPQFGDAPFRIKVDLSAPAEQRDGVVLAYGSRFGGWALSLQDGRPRFDHSLSPLPGDRISVQSKAALPASGNAELELDLLTARQSGGQGRQVAIKINGQTVAQVDIEKFVASAAVGETFDIGLDRGVTVGDTYGRDGRFTGTISKVTIVEDAPRANAGK